MSHNTATKWVIDPAHSSVEFSVKHMGIAWVKGRFTEFEAEANFDSQDPAGGSIQADIKTDSIWTGDEGRDNHLRGEDFFDVANHPSITFKSTKIEAAGDGSYKITGDVTIRGITHPVVFEGSYSGAREIPSGEGKEPVTRAGFTVKTTINRHDFKVSWDAPAGEGATTVGGEVEVNLNIELLQQ
ncbi:YceI family protein [Patescibacteria group bacterium]|nr:YceI family protein [Patescibacteria group bacterium]